MHAKSKTRRIRTGLAVIVGAVIVWIAAYFILQSVVRRRVEAALRNIPAPFVLSYGDIQPSLLKSSLVISGLHIRMASGPDTLHRQELVVDRLSVEGIRWFRLLTSHSIHLGTLRLEGCRVELDEELLEKPFPVPKTQGPLPYKEMVLDQVASADIMVKEYHVARGGRKETASFEGSLTVGAIWIADLNRPVDSTNLEVGGIRLMAKQADYLLPGAYERVRIKDLELNSRDSLLSIGAASISPTVDRLELGRITGVQTDVMDARCEAIKIEGLDIRALVQHRLTAEKIVVGGSKIHVFRDRRLRRDMDEKPLPVDYLKSMPVTVRVKSVKFGITSFSYEEFPGKGDSTGTIRIVRLSGSLTPLINHPVAGDPAYMTLKSEGSLMGSGTVTATTRLPLRKGEPYLVEGAFHELDVTTLNSSAENLGRIHLKSGILNKLAFQFDMGAEKATGQVVGEYHQLVVQKLKRNGEGGAGDGKDRKKIDKFKSFALREFIIPLNKDASMPESKRTGKVDYTRDRSRNFSFYLLHSLLVGVKSSFKLGFLLPG